VFDAADRKLAAQLQEPLRTDSPEEESRCWTRSTRSEADPAMGGSTDVGDVSWHVRRPALGGVFAAGSPGTAGRTWRRPLADRAQGMIVAAKVRRCRHWT